MPKTKKVPEELGFSHQSHTPVMVNEVLRYLAPSKGESYLDLTAGYGGHAAAVMRAGDKLADVTLVDRDAQAIDALKKLNLSGASLIQSDFLSASQKLVDERRNYDMILADLGASSQHLTEAGRGFSFLRPGPLDMRMDQTQEVTAAYVLNHSSQDELERILVNYGEERRAKTIAALIKSAAPIASTEQLASLIEQKFPRRFGKKIHPATKTFQALRIAVNDELGQLQLSLPLWHQLLKPGGRLALISFHSLEDRVVKRYFGENSGDRYDSDLNLLTKKPVTPSRDEIVSNPRARSAKLRAAAKIKTKRKD
jgi:16S rRNA (cytosine1402-N4)-methyltransferase